MHFTLGPIMLGKALPFRDEEPSAIFKHPAEGPVAVSQLGLEGDEQADLTVHGGIDKAIHHYPHDHYAFWMAALDGHELLANPGAFGENISTEGLTEDLVCIGDRYALGSAVVEVSQGRSPCWKVDHKFQRKGVTRRIVKTGRSGWYYRVIEPGTVSAGDALELVGRGHDAWSVAHVFALLIQGKAPEGGELAALVAHPSLSEEWKAKARAKLT